MDVGGGYSVTHDGLRSTRIDLDIALAYGFQQGSRIECSLDHGRISMNSADSEELSTRVMTGEEEGVCVLKENYGKLL